MAEWLIAPVLKTGIVLGTIEGSNPSLLFSLLNMLVSLIFSHERIVSLKEYENNRVQT